MKSKNIPKNFILGTLTAGASLILGFLSFSGMWSLAPILPLAFLSMGLAVSYEGEIYLQNIKGAINKLTNKNQIAEDLAKAYLLEYLLKLDLDDCPAFFKDYLEQVKLLVPLAINI